MAPAELPSNTVLNFFVDGEKNFWIGTQTGMERLTRTQVTVVSLPHANDSDFETIYRDRDGGSGSAPRGSFTLERER